MEEKQFFLEDLLNQYNKLKETNNLLKNIEDEVTEKSLLELYQESFRIVHQTKSTIGFLGLDIHFKIFQELENDYLNLKTTCTHKMLMTINNKVEEILSSLISKESNVLLDVDNIDVSFLLHDLKTKYENNPLFYKTRINIICKKRYFDRKISQCIFKITQQIVLNAIMHGKKKDGISINIYLNEDGNNINLDISNNGYPIDYSKLRKCAIDNEIVFTSDEKLLFLPLITSEESPNYYSGRGMGLNYVCKLVEEWRGKIDVISKNEYTNFHIELKKQLQPQP